MDGPQASSVRNLASLYSVVIGLSLSIGMYNLVDASKSPIPIKVELVPFFGAYFATLLPFYHGALRHLDARYVESGAADPHALLGDFIVLFVESCVFFALALLLPSPSFFTCALITLLIVDAVWGFVARLIFTPAKPETHWALINICTAVLLIILLAVMDGLPPRIPDQANTALGYVVLAVAVLRTVVDYKVTSSFYFPPN